MDDLDRAIINGLQGGFPISETPYADAAAILGTDEETLLARLRILLDDGLLSRFGPMYHAERMGGGLTLAAMHIPSDEFEQVAAQVNDLPEVAHNYEREHNLNMWFVVATEQPEQIAQVLAAIEGRTGHKVYNMPKLEEYFLGLKFDV